MAEDPLDFYLDMIEQRRLDNEVLNNMPPTTPAAAPTSDSLMPVADMLPLPTSPTRASSMPFTDEPDDIRTCIACAEDYPSIDVDCAACGHIWCRYCLCSYVELSFKGESPFPAYCCLEGSGSEVPIEENDFLPDELLDKYLAKKYEMISVNPVYCHNSDCVAFIMPGGISENIGTCRKCDTKTCMTCKRAVHEGACLPPDKPEPIDEDLLKLAEAENWRQCPRCSRFVQLVEGTCNHMSESSCLVLLLLLPLSITTDPLTLLACQCNADFCYACGLPWINYPNACGCPITEDY